DNALYNAFGQRLISTIYTQANQYRVVLEQDTEATPGLAALENIRLTSSDGGIVPLTAIATVEQRFTPLSVNHQGLSAASTISFNLPTGRSLSEASEAIDRAMTQLGVPSSVRGSFAGTAQVFLQTMNAQVILI
ncbi:efflux RND transporter permease subunit, partial [Serratia marcescens]|uniref:efflux RND transporter permease subunit n=1 Tax=Serratia marcescens TaxID=615 RepID=UPI0019535CCF